jgi:hypothetical protein
MMQPMGDYTPERLRTNRALLFGGGALFLGAYGTSAAVGLANERPADERLVVPVVGPWLDLGARQCDRTACVHEGLSKASLIASGALQGAGLVAMVCSLFVGERRPPVGRPGERHRAAAYHARFAPSAFEVGSGGRGGIALVGTF